MNTDNLFYKVDTECSILDKVFEFLPSANWEWVPYMNLAKNFPAKLLFEDAFLNSIPKKFQPTLRLYNFPSNTIYNWHRDANIGCSFNMVLDDYKAYTLFNPSDRLGITNEIVELSYEKQKWYLFNSQILHQVINLHHNNRYLLTITFPKIIKYNEVLEWVKNG